MARRSAGIRRALTTTVAIVLVAAGCTRGSTEVEVTAGGGGQPAATERATVPTEETGSRLDQATFGDLEDVCQDGDPSGSPDKGVTATEISVGTLSDKGASIRPGLLKEMWDTGVAFTKWCNEHGGINGRKLSLTDLDAKLMEYPSAIAKGCAADFALVGGGAGLDSGDGGARVKCGLPNIGSFAVSTEARTAPLQVFPVPLPIDQVMGGPLRVVAEHDPKAAAKLGTLTANLQSIIINTEQNLEYAEDNGMTSVYDDRYAVLGESNWRPFIQNLQDNDVQVLSVVGEPTDLIALQKAMKTVGWYPKHVIQQANYYDRTLIEEGAGVIDNTWVWSSYHPLEMADDNPATADFLELMERYNPKGRVAQLGQQGLSAWLLFAKAAKACGNDLTRDCLLAEAGQVTSWTGGGMHAETNPGKGAMAECFLFMKVTADGFEYDKALTRPNEGLYNCDPKNVGRVTAPATS